MEFYQDLAPFYDQMTSFEDRLIKDVGVFQQLIEKFPANSVLDAGCGSGFHSILLARLGLTVTGIDISGDMLDLAETNAKKYQTDPVFIKSDFLDMQQIPKVNFDAIYCLGNSFVHLLEADEQAHALRNFKNCLKKNGYLCIQIINYDKFLSERRETLSVKQVGDTTFTRLYTYHERTITFNIEIKKGDHVRSIKTELYPLRHEEILNNLEIIGFNQIQVYGNLHLDPYVPLDSENLCVIAYK